MTEYCYQILARYHGVDDVENEEQDAEKSIQGSYKIHVKHPQGS